MNGRGVIRTATALTGAIAVNAALLVGLAWLNQPAAVSAEQRSRVRVALRQPSALRQAAPAEPTPRTPERRQRTPEVTVAAPQPTPSPMPEVEVELDLALPRMAPVQVAVRRPTETSAPTPRAEPEPAPAREAATEAAAEAPAALEGPMSADRVDQPAREKPGNPRPRYPAVAARRGLEGQVTARLLINRRGRVERVEVLDVEGHPDFADAVLDVVDRYRFEPAVHDGRRVPQIGTKVFRFELRER
jgi:protein TonB